MNRIDGLVTSATANLTSIDTNATHIDQVARLVQVSQNTTEGRLALLLAMLVVVAVIVGAVEIGRVIFLFYGHYKHRKERSRAKNEEPMTCGVFADCAGQSRIEQRIDDIHDQTSTCSGFQRETISLVRDLRQGSDRSSDHIIEHLEANTQAVLANTKVLQSIADRIEFAAKAGLTAVVK